MARLVDARKSIFRSQTSNFRLKFYGGRNTPATATAPTNLGRRAPRFKICRTCRHNRKKRKKKRKKKLLLCYYCRLRRNIKTSSYSSSSDKCNSSNNTRSRSGTGTETISSSNNRCAPLGEEEERKRNSDNAGVMPKKNTNSKNKVLGHSKRSNNNSWDTGGLGSIFRAWLPALGICGAVAQRSVIIYIYIYNGWASQT